MSMSRTADGCHIYELGSSETFVRLLLHCKMSDHIKFDLTSYDVIGQEPNKRFFQFLFFWAVFVSYLVYR